MIFYNVFFCYFIILIFLFFIFLVFSLFYGVGAESAQICNVLKFFFQGCEDRDILWAFFTNLSIASLHLSI